MPVAYRLRSILYFLLFTACFFFNLSDVMAGAEEFLKDPSDEFVEQCTLLKIAEHCDVYASDKRLKENVKAIVRANLLNWEF